MAATSARGCWRINPTCILHWRHWDEGYVLFDAASGLTHALNVIGAVCLETLAAGSRDEAELAAAVRHELDLEPDELSAGELHLLLARFDELGLAEPVSA